jgi:hypothetical protein
LSDELPKLQNLFDTPWLTHDLWKGHYPTIQLKDAKAILHAQFDNELAILMKSDEAAGREPPDC